jgi:hypothetical protein
LINCTKYKIKLESGKEVQTPVSQIVYDYEFYPAERNEVPPSGGTEPKEGK